MATAEQAEVLPIVLTGQDNTKTAWDSLKRNASDAKSVVDGLSGAFEKLGGGNAAGGLEGLAGKARLLLNPYVAVGAAVIAAGVGAGLLHSQLSKAGEAADDLGESARAIDGLQIMLNKAGGEAGAAEQALLNLQTTIDKTSRDGGYLEDLFKLNGSSLTDAAGKVKPLEDVYKEVAGFIQNARNETERLEIATTAYGSQAAPAMVKAILSGASALDTLAGKSSDALDPAVKQAQEFDRLWKEITKSGDGLATTIRNAVLPVMGELYNRALQLAEFAGSKSAAQSRYLLNNPNANRLMDNQNEIDRFYNAVGFGATKTPSSRKETDTANELDRATNQINKHIALMQADAQAVGQSAGEHERLRVQAQLLDAAQRAGIKPTEDQIRKFDELAQKAKAAADALAFAKLQNDLMFERDQLGRSALEQTVQSRLRGAGIDPNSAQAEMLASQIRLNETIKETQDISKDALKGFIDDLRAGKSGAEAFADALGKISSKLEDKALDAVINAVTGGGGGVIGKLFGFGGASAGAGAFTGQDLALNQSLFPGYGTGHSGAIIGQRSTGTKVIHPSYFDDAPRFHGGGVLGTDEVPFIGLKGEVVGFPDQLRRMYGGGGGGGSISIGDVYVTVPDGTRPDDAAAIGDAVKATMIQVADERIAQAMRPRGALNSDL